MMHTMHRYLRFVARHPVAYPVVAVAAAAVSVALYPGDVWAWTSSSLAVAWLAVTVSKKRPM